MDETKLKFDDLTDEVSTICEDLITLATTPGPTRCVAKLTDVFDPRIGANKMFPMFEEVKKIVERWNNKENNLILFREHGNIILISGFDDKPSDEKIKDIPVTLASHADEITFTKKKYSSQLIPLFNAKPLQKYGIVHPAVEIFGFRGSEDDREFKKVGRGTLRLERERERGKLKFSFYLDDITREIKEGDLIIQNYNKTNNKHDIDTIFHMKALDDRAGMLAHLYTMRELDKSNIKAKAILLGDEEGIDADVAWARLAKPTFRKFCSDMGLIIICDGYDGLKLYEFEDKRDKHLKEALVAPYRSEGKGAGDPGLFSLFRDHIISTVKRQGFEAITTTDYVSRSLDPKIMDDFPFICNIDWSNGPAVPLKEDFLPVCHVDESVAVEQLINIIGTTYFTVEFFVSKYKLACQA